MPEKLMITVFIIQVCFITFVKFKKICWTFLFEYKTAFTFTVNPIIKERKIKLVVYVNFT